MEKGENLRFLAPEKQKTEEKSPEIHKNIIDKRKELVYNGLPYCGSMPIYAILPNMSILAQNMEAVKYKLN
mgnify:CR=1 FL=1